MDQSKTAIMMEIKNRCGDQVRIAKADNTVILYNGKISACMLERYYKPNGQMAIEVNRHNKEVGEEIASMHLYMKFDADSRLLEIDINDGSSMEKE